MKLTLKLLCLEIVMTLGAISAIAADNQSTNSVAPGPAATNAPNEQVIAYYFHATVRCETCLNIEKRAQELIKRRFKSELEAKRVVFQPVNYETPENKHFLIDYKLPCPSLVLVRQEKGKDVRWKLLDDTWTLIETPAAFDEYVEKELNKLLKETK